MHTCNSVTANVFFFSFFLGIPFIAYKKNLFEYSNWLDKECAKQKWRKFCSL